MQLSAYYGTHPNGNEMKRFFATARICGEREYFEADTLDELRVLLFGRAYAAPMGTPMYERQPIPRTLTDGEEVFQDADA